MKSHNKPHILLLYPKTGVDLGSTVAPPHALLTISAPLLKAGYQVKILDQRVEAINEKIIQNYISSDLICVGTTAMTGTQIQNALNLTALVRKLTPSTPIIWGGAHPSVIPEQTVNHPNVDYVVIGEGEDTFLELVQTLEKKGDSSKVLGIAYQNGSQFVQTETRTLIKVESLLPTPWELINVENYIHKDMYLKNKVRVLDIGQTSRGCPYKCSFCSSASIRNRKWRSMTAEKSLDMIIESVKRFNLDGIWLRDDEFYIRRSRGHKIFEGIVNENLNISFYTSGTRADVFLKASDDEIQMMQKAGAHTLKFGAESGSQRILDLMNKGITPEDTLKANLRCKQFGITPAFSLMVGYPTETFADMDKTIELGFRLKDANPQAELETMGSYMALPGTPDYKLSLDHGLKPPTTLEDWANWVSDDYDLLGLRSPWYNKAERIYIGNIGYMSILANALVNIMGTVKNRPARFILQNSAKIVSKFYKMKLKNKLYRFAPELQCIRYLRKEIFYDNEIIA